MPRLTKFPYNQPGHQHWEAMKELFFRYKAHERYTGVTYYEEQYLEMRAMPDADIPWCCEYTKRAFVKAWNKTKKLVELQQAMGWDL